MGTKDEQKYTDKAYEDYRAHREKLVDGEQECAHNFDKYLIALSSGALGLSLSFIEKIAPRPRNLWEIYVFWSAFALSLLLVLAALFVSQRAFNKERDIFDAGYTRDRDTPIDERAEQQVEVNRWTPYVDRFTNLSALAFVIGVLFLAHFSMLNLKERSDAVANKPPPGAGAIRRTTNSPSPPRQPAPRPQPPAQPQKPGKR